MTYAQFHEDDWLLAQFPHGFCGYACEVGAYDGLTRSTTLLLEQHRWTVLCIEPNPGPLAQLRKSRAFVQPYACGPARG